MSSDTGVELQVDAAPHLDEVTAIGSELSAFNEQAALPYDKQPLAVFLRSADDRLLGGLTGHTNWSWLYVDCFWLAEAVRGSGWGSRTLRAAEEAVKRGCRGSRLLHIAFRHSGSISGTDTRYLGCLTITRPAITSIGCARRYDKTRAQPPL